MATKAAGAVVLLGRILVFNKSCALELGGDIENLQPLRKEMNSSIVILRYEQGFSKSLAVILDGQGQKG